MLPWLMPVLMGPWLAVPRSAGPWLAGRCLACLRLVRQ